MNEQKIILETKKLKKYFPIKRKVNLKAIEDITLQIYEGEKFGVVGESGCGKSTLGRVILQLYPQTSGSCIYYGKSIQEINPKYIKKEINSLEEYQKKASQYYKESLSHAQRLQTLYRQLNNDNNETIQNDKKDDRINKEISQLEYKAKELRKKASRELREGSRTVGSLILCKNIKEIAHLFSAAEKEIHLAHEDLQKYNELYGRLKSNEITLKEISETPSKIEALEKQEQLDEVNQEILRSLKKIAKENSKIDSLELIKENFSLDLELDKLRKRMDKHHEIELGYRNEAFTYRGKDILPITELALNSNYQKKLDANYEKGINLNKLDKEEMRSIRRDMQMIFQDPAASLDPRQSVGRAIEEVYRINTDYPNKVIKEKAMELLEKVGLKREYYYSYPNALSGGQKQRVGIARAIALDPSFVVLDEAVSALDVSVQAQVLQLLNQLSDEKHLTYFFITHDLGVVKHFCDRIMVMYLGNICELAPSKELFKHRLHPYTESLLDSVPRLSIDGEKRTTEILKGEVPSAINPPSGCPFHTRCSKCMEVCKTDKPKYVEAMKDHFVACHLYDEVKNKGEQQ